MVGHDRQLALLAPEVLEDGDGLASAFHADRQQEARVQLLRIVKSLDGLSGGDDLPLARHVGDAGSDVDGVTEEIARPFEDVPEVTADVNAQFGTFVALAVDGDLHRRRGFERLVGLAEVAHQPIAHVLDHPPVIGLDHLAEPVETFAYAPRRQGIADFLIEARAAADIDKEHHTGLKLS